MRSVEPRRAAAWFARVAAALLLCAIVAGCTAEPDPDQAHLCRLAEAATSSDAEPPTIVRQSMLLDDSGAEGVRLDLAARLGSKDPRARFAECRFATGADRLRMTSFRTERGMMPVANFVILQRFWLEQPESAGADPLPVSTARALVTLPRDAAYFLQQLLNALPSMATYAMLSAAYALVYGLIGRINLAFGEMAAIGGVAALVGASFLQHPAGLPLVVATITAALWAATTHGLVISHAVFRPLARSTTQQGLVATVGLALVLNEYLRLAQGSTPRWITPVRESPVLVARSGDFLVTVTPLALELAGVFAVAATGILLLMNRSQFGRNWRALSNDATAAALLGVSPTRVFAQSFALASALAGLAGATVVLIYGSFGTTLGSAIGLKGLLAAVLGGIGSVRGALIGGIVISAIEAAWSSYFPIEYRDLVLFCLLAVALIVRPGGFFGDPEIRPRLV